MIKHLRLPVLMAAFIGRLQAGQSQTIPHFIASSTKTEVSAGETFEVTFSLDNSGNSFTAPDFKGFQVISGPNVSTSMSVVNGNMSQSNAYTFDLVAPQPGTYAIRPASVKVNGKLLVSNTLSIKVVKGQTPPQNSGATAQPGNPNAQSITASGNLSKDLFIRAIADKTHVYQGEQLTVTFKLYFRVSIVDNNAEKMPSFTGFWNQDVKSVQQNPQVKNEVYKGASYKVAELKQTVLFAEHSGDIAIDPVAMSFVVRQMVKQRSVDPFNDPFSMDPFFAPTRDTKVVVKSDPLIIHVKPLPAAGKPSDFTNAVGNFEMKASIDKPALKTNEALNYTLNVHGNGNLKLLAAPALSVPPDFEKFDPKITDSINVLPSGVSGSRKFNILLIPRHQGRYTLPSSHFSYFNPTTGKYVTLATKTFDLTVEKGTGQNAVTAFSPTQQHDITQIGNDIRYIKSEGVLHNANTGHFFNSPGYYALLLLGPLFFMAGSVYKKYQSDSTRDVVKVKSKTAGKIASRHLDSASRQLSSGNKKTFYEDLSKGLYGYFSDKLNIPFADLSKEKIQNGLRERQISGAVMDQLTDTLQRCEMAQYAPMSNVSENELLARSKKIIYDIESQI